MAQAVKISADVTKFTIEEIAALSPHAMEKVLKAMPQEHRTKLLKECEKIVLVFSVACTRVGYECADSKQPGQVNPYTMLKKYSHIYTCLAGYQTSRDLHSKTVEKWIKAVEAKLRLFYKEVRKEGKDKEVRHYFQVPDMEMELSFTEKELEAIYSEEKREEL